MRVYIGFLILVGSHIWYRNLPDLLQSILRALVEIVTSWHHGSRFRRPVVSHRWSLASTILEPKPQSSWLFQVICGVAWARIQVVLASR